MPSFTCTPTSIRARITSAPLAPSTGMVNVRVTVSSVPRLGCYLLQGHIVADRDPTAIGRIDDDGALTAKVRQHPAHRLDGQAKMVRYIAAAHREI